MGTLATITTITTISTPERTATATPATAVTVTGTECTLGTLRSFFPFTGFIDLEGTPTEGLIVGSFNRCVNRISFDINKGETTGTTGFTVTDDLNTKDLTKR